MDKWLVALQLDLLAHGIRLDILPVLTEEDWRMLERQLDEQDELLDQARLEAEAEYRDWL